MKCRFNPDSGVVTIVRDENAYNAKKRTVAFGLLEMMRVGFDSEDDRCLICGARVDLNDIETFELSDCGLICYFCTCDPNELTQLIDTVQLEVYYCRQCDCFWEGEPIEGAGTYAYCPECLVADGRRAACLSSSHKSQNNPKK